MSEFFILGATLGLLGSLMFLAGAIWGVVSAFKEGMLWGVLMLVGFFSGFQIVSWCLFALKHFDEAYPSFLLYVGGLIPMVIGASICLMELTIKLVAN